MTTKVEFDAMDLRLKQWGAWCRAGGRDPALWESDGRHGAGMTRDQVEDAWRLQCMVMRLPIEMRIVCQVQYVCRPEEPVTGHGEGRVAEVNRRIRAAGVHRRLSADDCRAVRERAVNNLINADRLTAVLKSVSCRSNGPRTRAPKIQGLAA
jgi:hypothetical protein